MILPNAGRNKYDNVDSSVLGSRFHSWSVVVIKSFQALSAELSLSCPSTITVMLSVKTGP
uniref:Uncharacterized protein n=1 Tax=Anguilla anguilla TaxID=7936 RepID=A0A0E9SXN8_ANGAN